MDRFLREELSALQPLNGKPPFLQIREVYRTVHSEACVELDTNKYSVPWQLIGAKVLVSVTDGEVKVIYKDQEVARHAQNYGRHAKIIDPKHLKGIVGMIPKATGDASCDTSPKLSERCPSELLRPLSEYEELIGGGW